MARELRVYCPVCEMVTVDIAATNVLLRNTAPGNSLVSKCPKCLDAIEVGPLTRPMIAALVGAGVTVIDQMVECLVYPSAPPLTEVDAKAFVTGIEDVWYLASFARRECDKYRRELLDAQ